MYNNEIKSLEDAFTGGRVFAPVRLMRSIFMDTDFWHFAASGFFHAYAMSVTIATDDDDIAVASDDTVKKIFQRDCY